MLFVGYATGSVFIVEHDWHVLFIIKHFKCSEVYKTPGSSVSESTAYNNPWISARGYVCGHFL